LDSSLCRELWWLHRSPEAKCTKFDDAFGIAPIYIVYLNVNKMNLKISAQCLVGPMPSFDEVLVTLQSSTYSFGLQYLAN
jgi:hypothetical protein